MKIKLHSKFKKAYKSRIASNQKLVLQTSKRIILFQIDPKNPILKDHSLSADFRFRSTIF